MCEAGKCNAASQYGSIAELGAPEVALPSLSIPVYRLQIGELCFPDDAGVAVHLALDLVLKLAAGFGELTDHDEDLAASGHLADLGTKPHLLVNRELMRLHDQEFQEAPVASRPRRRTVQKLPIKSNNLQCIPREEGNGVRIRYSRKLVNPAGPERPFHEITRPGPE